ncbi:TVP38/TMEM64 family protein [Evansella cellulosilytica]|uniref:TVP38/TMEM64 family membrane protein n=1 Tax=Evansella cellulosilytica (strain ATCC 21833 / DSM 2522 / FERM P-1141 / JCM 9156 / N-4) TaxID=649639 RepID=E6TYX5_EVAC2|nr:VTT domain-containing protein [Evansella cellulosilytica]ADU31310.1 SNARE associated Golgi protein-related protein [Evansella cellulosilytica DSM 2522]
MKYFILLLLFVLIGFGLYNQQDWLIYFKSGDWATLHEMMGQELLFILLITFTFMIMQNVLSLIPFLFLTMFNIWLFGFLNGYLWSLMGNFLGSVLVFYLARYSFQEWGHKYNHLRFKQQIEQNGFKVILFMRLFPFMPASIVNIGSGLSKIKAKDYVLATFIGNTVFVFLLSLFSAGVIALEYQNTIYVLLTISLLVFAVIKLRKMRLKDRLKV